jgi:DNA-binding transcriptional regulator PaaX
VVHEEEERPIVVGDEAAVKSALEAMVKQGKVVVAGEGDSQIYKLA